jgi:hypothetical protein
MALLPRMLSELPLPAESRGIIVELQNLLERILRVILPLLNRNLLFKFTRGRNRHVNRNGTVTLTVPLR